MASDTASNYEQFGKYVLLEKIAAGGMAEVYLAKSAVANGLNKFVAVKRILPQFSQNEDFVEMFKEEAKVAINLNHGNIVSIYDFGVEKKQFFLVMEFMEGRNLRQVINELKKNNKSFTIEQAIFMIKEVAAGLDHAHRCVDANSGRPLNITHRDMSPQNIMLSFEGEIKVIDFGIAKAETEKEETKAGTLKGKFSYMSPEQAEGQNIDPRTDVFALGIVLWELLANDRLFTGSNEATILRKVRECQVPQIRKVNPLVPQELERIVMKALAKDRNVRYQTAANLHRDLNRFINTQYPDFSSHDFSQFLKDAFRTIYSEAREKLMLYSKVDLSVQQEMLEATATAPASTRHGAVNIRPVAFAKPEPQREGSSSGSDAINPPAPPGRSIPVDELPPGFNENPSRPTLEGVLGSFVAKPTVAERNQRSPTSTTTGKNPNAPVGHTRITQISKVQPRATASRDFAEISFKSILFFVLVGGGFWAYKNKMVSVPEFSSQAILQQFDSTSPDRVPAKNLQTDMAETALVKASISSSPFGAQIFIDNKDTGYRTPAVISFTANKETSVKLIKDGYLPYETTKTLSQTGQITATLQVAAQVGSVNIYIANGGPSTRIYVNGKELSEKAPVLKYSILADAESIIRAYNPITKQSDELKVKVRTGENRNIELILGRIPVTSK
jgi:serine/threonine protein kinase